MHFKENKKKKAYPHSEFNLFLQKILESKKKI